MEGISNNNVLYDDNFQLISIYSEGTKLLGLEVSIKHKGSEYFLNIETFGLHAERTATDLSDDEDDRTYVIAADEVFPSDVWSIKQKAFQDLLPYLIASESD